MTDPKDLRAWADLTAQRAASTREIYVDGAEGVATVTAQPAASGEAPPTPEQLAALQRLTAESEAMGLYGVHALPAEPVACPRNELVVAIHTLASHFENSLYAFRDDAEALLKAKRDIAWAMKTAAKHNQNGPGCAAHPPVAPLTTEAAISVEPPPHIEALAAEMDSAGRMDVGNALRSMASLAAVRQAVAPLTDAWRPIETAPKDATDILLTNGESVSVGHWLHVEPYIREIRDLDGRYIDQDESDGHDGWIDWGGGMIPEPTGWMPLPAPPLESALEPT